MDELKEAKVKNKVYQENQKSKRYIVIAIVIFVIYVFFFTSKLIIPDPITDKNLVTKFGKETDFAENRTYTLISAQYSEEQKMMEVVLSLNNKNYDKIDDYFYAITSTGANTKKITINEIYNEELFTVIRLENVPKKYGEINLMFAPKTTSLEDVTDEQTGSIIINKYNISNVDNIDLNKTKSGYLKERLDGMITSLENRLDKQQNRLDELKTKAAALQEDIDSFESDKKYMTNDEINNKQEIVLQNQTDIKEINAEISKQESKIKATKVKIKDAKTKKAAL